MKILTSTIAFQLPDDFKGDDLNLALEEFIKYRRAINKNSLNMPIEYIEETDDILNKVYYEFMEIMADENDERKTVHASSICKLSNDMTKWENNT